MQHGELATVVDATNRMQMEAAVQTLTSLGNPGESLAEIAHDARNMVTALGLYCDLLETPGVLATPFEHYGSELKGLAATSRRLVEKLAALKVSDPAAGRSASGHRSRKRHPFLDGSAAKPVAFRELLGVDFACPGRQSSRRVALQPESSGRARRSHHQRDRDAERGELPVRLASEDLTRILVNLVKNSVEAMPSGGRIRIVLREGVAEPGAEPSLTLNVEDNGPGIPREALESIFEAGFTTRSKADAANGKAGWRSEHRGLGLSITRSIVEAAGGRIHAANRDPSGACFQIELPVRIC